MWVKEMEYQMQMTAGIMGEHLQQSTQVTLMKNFAPRRTDEKYTFAADLHYFAVR